MNKQAQMILAAMAGSRAFKVIPKDYPDKYTLDFQILADEAIITNDRWFDPIVPFSDCTIQARPIESLTLEEKAHFEHIEYNDIVERTSDSTQWFINNPEPFLYLISIGVLPKYYADKLTEAGINIEWVVT